MEHKHTLRFGCAALCLSLTAGLLTSCSLLPAASPLPARRDTGTQEQPLYDASVFNDGALRLFSSELSGKTVLCGSQVVGEFGPSDTVFLLDDELSGETNYFFRNWADRSSPSGRASALYDKTGKAVLTFSEGHYASLSGNYLLLSSEHSYEELASMPIQSEDCQVIDLSTGETLPTPPNAQECVAAGDTFIYTCYDRPAGLGEDEYDDDFYLNRSAVFCDRAGNVLRTDENTYAQSIYFDSAVPSDWAILYRTDSSSQVLICNPSTGEQLSNYENYCGNGTVCVKSIDGRHQLIDLVSAEHSQVLASFDSNVSCYFPGYVILWVDGNDSHYELYDLASGEQTRLWGMERNADTVAFYTTDGALRVYNSVTGTLLTDAHVEPVANLQRVFVSTEGHGWVWLQQYDNDNYERTSSCVCGPDGKVRTMDLTALREKYQNDYISPLFAADDDFYFSISYSSPTGSSLQDILDSSGNVVLSSLGESYNYSTSLPEGVFPARRGFYTGWMDLNGNWVYCQSIFSADDEPEQMMYS